jgi:outer membrane biosynthesis protein TonB
MRRPFIYSLILHLLVIAVVILGLPSLQQPPAFEQEPVVVELVAAGSSKAPPMARSAPTAEPQQPAESPAPKPEPPQPTAEPKPEPRPQPQPKPEASPARQVEPRVAKPEPSPPEPMRKPEPKAEPRPAPAKPDLPKPEKAEPKPQPKTVARAEPEPEPKTEPRPQAKPKPPAEQKPEAVRPETKPTPAPERKSEPPEPTEGPAKRQPPKPEASKPDSQKPEPAKTERKPESASDFASVLKTVGELKQQASKGEDKPAKPAPPTSSSKDGTSEGDSGFTSQVAQALRSSGPAGNKPSLPVSSSEIDTVRRQIERCWSLPGGAKEAGNLVVSIRVEMNVDGTPRSALVVNTGQVQANPYYQAVADSARRAVLNPRCHPFKLPPEKYDHWRTMTLIFNPKEMS